MKHFLMKRLINEEASSKSVGSSPDSTLSIFLTELNRFIERRNGQTILVAATNRYENSFALALAMCSLIGEVTITCFFVTVTRSDGY